MDIWSKNLVLRRCTCRGEFVISEHISNNIPAQTKILNYDYSHSFSSPIGVKSHVILQNVMQLMTSNYFQLYIVRYILSQIFEVIQSVIALQNQVH